MNPLVIRQSPLVLIRRIIQVEIVFATFLFAVSFLANYQEIYETVFLSRFLRYHLFLFTLGAVSQLVITVIVFVSWNSEEYRIRDKEIVHKSGIFFSRERSVLISRITEVEYRRSFLEFMLRYGTISLSIAGQEKPFLIESIEAAEIYSGVIKDLAASASRSAAQVSSAKLSILDQVLEGEHSKLEFKQTFRWDVKQGATSKALEKSVMKTVAAFLNSDGGTLLIGITDSGGVHGLDDDYRSLLKKDRDGFENHFNQVLKLAIGAEFRQYVAVSFEAIEGKDVCMVAVSPAPKPAYLSMNNEEEFYIRTGNSTTALSVRETHSYIESHWKKGT